MVTQCPCLRGCREEGQRRASRILGQPGNGPLEASIVIKGDLVADVVAAVVGIGCVRGTTWTTHEGTVEDVAVIHGVGYVTAPTSVGPPMVGIDRGIIAEADHVTAGGGVLAQHVIDLSLCKVMVTGADVSDFVSIDHGKEGGVGRVAQRSPLIQPSEAAGRVGDLSAGAVAHSPVVEPVFGGRLVDTLAGQFGQKDGGSVRLVVPGMSPSEFLARDILAVEGLGLV